MPDQVTSLRLDNKKELVSQQAHRENESNQVRVKQTRMKVKVTVTRKGFLLALSEIFSKLPKEDPFPEDTLNDIMAEKKPEEQEEWKPEKEPTGFFPIPPAEKKSKPAPEASPVQEPVPELPSIRHDGFIPNSVLVHLLWPQQTLAELKQREKTYIPPQLTAEQMEQIESANKKRGVKWREGTPEHTMYLDYDDEDTLDADREKEETEDEVSPSFLQKVQDMLDRAPSAEMSETAVESRAETPAVGKDVPSREVSRDASALMLSAQDSDAETKPQKPKRELRPRQPVQKLIAPKPPSQPATPANVSRHTSYKTAGASAPPPRERTPTPPPTPLPEFITQFIGAEWFDKYFPNCNTNTMPKPWTVPAFVAMLARVLRIADYPYKVPITEGLLAIHQEHGILNGDTVSKVLYTIFNHHSHPPSCLDEDEKNFIVAAIKLMHALGNHDKDFFTELMTQFLEGDKEVRKLVMETITTCGLKDPHNHFPKELDSWDVWSLEDSERGSELRKMCRAWLDKWMSTFKIHMEDTIERLKRGQSVHSRATPSQLGKKSASSSKSILRKPAVDNINETEEDVSKMEGVQFVQPQDSLSRGATTVTFDSAPDLGTIENATYMEAINYFCEMELEKMLDVLRGGGRSTNRSGGGNKNTVLVLPKISSKPVLVRLGETHTSKCRPQRETALAVDLRLPPVTSRGHQPAPGQLYGFPPCINLPMKSVYMNPFGPEDSMEPAYEQPVLLMLKTAQKYFVHSRSVVPAEPVS